MTKNLTKEVNKLKNEFEKQFVNPRQSPRYTLSCEKAVLGLLGAANVEETNFFTAACIHTIFEQNNVHYSMAQIRLALMSLLNRKFIEIGEKIEQHNRKVKTYGMDARNKQISERCWQVLVSHFPQFAASCAT